MSIDAPSGVHNVAESENTLFSAGNCPARVDAIVAFKVVHAKGISGKEAVSAHVPVRWKERIVLVIYNSMAPLLAADKRPRIVNPSRLYAPRRLCTFPVFKNLSL